MTGTTDKDITDAFEMMGWNDSPSMEIQTPSDQIILSDKGLVKVEKAPWVKLNVSFRKVLSRLKGAKLAVFLDIALHVGKGGTSYPSIETMAKETGYCEDVVRDTIHDLQEMGFLSIQENKGRTNTYTPSMFFAYGKNQEPWDEENEPTEPLGEIPPLDKSSTPPLGESSTPPWEKVLPEEEPVRRIIENNAAEPAAENPAEKRKRSTAEALFKGIAQHAGKVDVADYPEEVQPTIQAICSLWHLQPPRKNRRKAGEYSDWVNGAREVNDACGEFGLNLLTAYADKYNADRSNNGGAAPFTVSRPGSLPRVIRGFAAEVRATGSMSFSGGSKYDIHFDN